MVTARGEEAERVLALDAGADDYLVKPFGLAELQARIRAVLRRVRPGSEVARHGPLTVDMRTRKVSVAGADIALTPKEFDILECLVADPGRVVSRQEILESAWDLHWYGPTKVLDVHMAALRKKLGVPGLIETVYGRGFRLSDILMTRRIVLAILAVICALLGAVVIPLGLITAQHDRQDFRDQAVSTARSLASVAEEKLGDHESGAALTAAMAQLRGDGDQVAVYGGGGRRIAGAGPPVAPGVIHSVLSSETTTARTTGSRLLVLAPVRSDEGHHEPRRGGPVPPGTVPRWPMRLPGPVGVAGRGVGGRSPGRCAGGDRARPLGEPPAQFPGGGGPAARRRCAGHPV